MKNLPLNITNFERIIRDDYYFIDKTHYIPLVEQRSSFIMLLRPRSMGKSLFSNMMIAYYDVAKKDLFENLFGSLWIGKNPTKLANKFVILNLNFSKIERDIDNLAKNFTQYCFSRLNELFRKYKALYCTDDIEFVLGRKTITDAINAFINLNQRIGYLTYLFIDEYDNFTNSVLAARGVEEHYKITHNDGFYRSFFSCCKDSFDRIFMTGVAPVTYDDLTSGFNIADPISLEEKYDQIVGITETELLEMIGYYQNQGAITKPTGEIIADIKPYYDGFSFSARSYYNDPPIYNTSSVLRYLNILIDTGYPPEEMIDYAARTEPSKLNYLVMSEDLSNRELRIDAIKEICTKGFTTGHVKTQFSAIKAGEQENFISMLFYYGTLTFGGTDRYGQHILKVPNKNMGDLYMQYMLQMVGEVGLNLNDARKGLHQLLLRAAVDGEWEPLADKIGELYHQYTSVFNSKGGEYDVQGFLRGLLCLNGIYDLWPELELNSGRGDILLIPLNRPDSIVHYSYIIELKYMKVGDKNIEQSQKDAEEQLQKYAGDLHLHESGLLRGSECRLIYLIFQGQTLIDKQILPCKTI